VYPDKTALERTPRPRGKTPRRKKRHRIEWKVEKATKQNVTWKKCHGKKARGKCKKEMLGTKSLKITFNQINSVLPH